MTFDAINKSFDFCPVIGLAALAIRSQYSVRQDRPA
jgi:hypothetical protein